MLVFRKIMRTYQINDTCAAESKFMRKFIVKQALIWDVYRYSNNDSM